MAWRLAFLSSTSVRRRSAVPALVGINAVVCGACALLHATERLGRAKSVGPPHDVIVATELRPQLLEVLG